MRTIMLADVPVTTILPAVGMRRARVFYEDKIGFRAVGMKSDG